MKVKNKKKGFSMLEILISAAIILTVSSIVMKAYSNYLREKREVNICENNKELFHIACEDIRYNLDVDKVEKDLLYIPLDKEKRNKIITTPIEKLLVDNCNINDYISILSKEDEKQLEFNIALYCNGKLCDEKRVRRSKIII